MKPLTVLLLLSGCATAPAVPPPHAATGRQPGVYTPTSLTAVPNGGISTSCVFDTNGLGAACRPLDRAPEGPIPPISAGQPR